MKKYFTLSILLCSVILFASGCTSALRFTSAEPTAGAAKQTPVAGIAAGEAGALTTDNDDQSLIPDENAEDFSRGMASYYGDVFQGRRTASGESYDRNELTAAHRYLPFGTKVLVKNLRNNRSVIVRINDRGPFVGKRVIDLSQAAAEEIGMIHAGIAEVELRILN